MEQNRLLWSGRPHRWSKGVLLYVVGLALFLGGIYVTFIQTAAQEPAQAVLSGRFCTDPAGCTVDVRSMSDNTGLFAVFGGLICILLMELQVRRQVFGVDEHGVFARTGFRTLKEDRVPFNEIDEVKVTTAPIERPFGTCTIKILREGDDKTYPSLSFTNIRDCQGAVNAIKSQLEEAE